MSRWRWLLAALPVALLVAQAVPVARTNPPVPNDIQTPPEVKAMLRRACYDCHSNETVWPWYSRVAPVSWLVAHDVDEGRGDLDFSTWKRYGAPGQVKKLRKSAEEIAEGEMPPWYYVLMHPEARLSDADRQALAAWIDGEVARLAP